MTSTTKWLAGLNGLLGLWLIAAPFALGVQGTAMWNAVIVGALIAIIGGYNFYRTTQDEEVNLGAASLNALLGLWVIAAPFVFGVGTTVMWNDIIVGGLVAIFAGYNAYVANEAKSSASAQAA